MSEPAKGDYGAVFATVYDDLYGSRDDTDQIAEVVAELAAGEAVLELGVGTGRLALPIASRGVPVVGVDNSSEMLDKLREKPGSDGIEAVEGDMVELQLERRFAVVLCAFSTAFLLPSQEDQVRLFAMAARHLIDGGVLVIECFVHDPTRWRGRQEVTALAVEDGSVAFRLALHDPASQTIKGQQVTISEKGVAFRPSHLRYASPAELDLMARLAGLSLVERWSDWSRETFGPDHSEHVSVYRKDPAAPTS